MFQITSLLAFLISLLAGTPSRPRLASSKSALSASGRTWRCRFCASMVKVEGGLPFGLKCSGGAAAVCACAESAVRHRDDVNATSAMLESAQRPLPDVFVARNLIAVHPVMVRSSFDSGSRFAVGLAVVRNCHGAGIVLRGPNRKPAGSSPSLSTLGAKSIAPWCNGFSLEGAG